MGSVEKFVKRHLGDYKQKYNQPDLSLPKKIEKEKSVAIIGSGIAGLSAAILLADRGFKVEVFEKERFLGGKVGSWTRTFDDGTELRMEHGFHAFFRQYYNLRGLLDRLDISKNLIPIDDYLILAEAGETRYSFRGISTTPVSNVLSLRKAGVFTTAEALFSPRYAKLLSLFKYDEKRTFEKYDGISFEEFSKKAGLSKNMKLMFTTFSRVFFAQPEDISMAELIKSFHFYFLSNDEGLVYDVLNDDFEKTLLSPIREFVDARSGRFHMNTEVTDIDKTENGFKVNGDDFDYLILGTDIKGAKRIISNLDWIDNFPKLKDQLTQLKLSRPYAVLRIWTDSFIEGDYPFFIFTDSLKVLDSVSIYHEMEAESRRWSEENNGGIYELHSYAVPKDFNLDDVRGQLLTEFFHYFPSMKKAKINYENLQLRDDFTAFHTNLHKERPEVKTDVPGFYLAADWVKIPIPAMLMENSCAAAFFAANEILSEEGLVEEQIYTVPPKGVLKRN